MTNPVYLDLDAVVPDVEIVVKFGGQEHKLAPITVEDFVRNTQQVEQMGTQVDAAKEMELLGDMLTRAFPTMGRETIRSLTLPQLNKLLEFAMENNGGNRVKKEAEKEANENPPETGQ